MSDVQPRQQRPHRPLVICEARFPEGASVPGDRQNVRLVFRLRDRPRCAAETRRRGLAEQYAMADDPGGKGEGQGGVSVWHQNGGTWKTILADCSLSTSMRGVAVHGDGFSVRTGSSLM